MGWFYILAGLANMTISHDTWTSQLVICLPHSQDTSTWKSTCSVQILRELKWLPFEVWTLSELEWDHMREET
jgi:hypothetical protein